jgi:hypothetical protein
MAGINYKSPETRPFLKRKTVEVQDLTVGEIGVKRFTRRQLRWCSQGEEKTNFKLKAI